MTVHGQHLWEQDREARQRRMKEKINHPIHYGGGANIYETIKVIEAWKLGFHIGNCVKYISRAGKKEGSEGLEDLKKARWYLDREIETIEREGYGNGNEGKSEEAESDKIKTEKGETASDK